MKSCKKILILDIHSHIKENVDVATQRIVWDVNWERYMLIAGITYYVDYQVRYGDGSK